MGQLDTSRRQGCELCENDGGLLVARTPLLRVIRADEPEHPAFYRVIWQDHVGEWTDLSALDRAHMMGVVEAIELTLREHLNPKKINLATLGNVVPHLHWHVIARFEWDARWPAPVWAAKERSVPDASERLGMPLAELDKLVAKAVLALVRPPLN